MEAVNNRSNDALHEVGKHEKCFGEKVEEIRVIAIPWDAPAVNPNRHDCLEHDSNERNDVETLHRIGSHRTRECEDYHK